METLLTSLIVFVMIGAALYRLYKTHHSLSLIIKFSRNRAWVMSLFLFIFVILILDMFLEYIFHYEFIKKQREGIWDKTISQYITLGTFLAAFTAWFTVLYKDWKESLPKRLSIYFSHEEKIVMQCNYSHLDGEGDIRALAQQIGGRQMTSGNIDFIAPSIHWKEVDIIFTKNKLPKDNNYNNHLNFPFRHYVVLFKLEKLPEPLGQNQYSYLWNTYHDEKHRIKEIPDSFDSKNYCYNWNPPFDVDKKENKNHEKTRGEMFNLLRNEILQSENFKDDVKNPLDKKKLTKIKYNKVTEICSKDLLETEDFETKFWQKIEKNNGYCTNEDLNKSDAKEGDNKEGINEVAHTKEK